MKVGTFVSAIKSGTLMGKVSFIFYGLQISELIELNNVQINYFIRYLVQFLQKGSLPSKRESNALLVAFGFLKLHATLDFEKYERRKEYQKKTG